MRDAPDDAARCRVFDDAGQLAEHAAALILAAAREAIAARGAFHLVLAGGETPLATYACLAGAGADWRYWRLYFSDERCLPAGDPGRNDTQIRRQWLERVPIPAGNIHAIPAELGPERAAAHYAGTLAGVSAFDLVLLGLGEDGHTASLFPGRPVGPGTVLPVRDAPKPPPERVTLSASRLSGTRATIFLITGAGKRAAVAAWRGGTDVPAGHVAGPDAVVTVLLDAAAAPPDCVRNSARQP
ncbi:MAG: 6-phosphogluconolactonase [Gammaproteobacteria bacterium]|nr:6-phosphogluconolactonase [Gammaproteobacteria bacterium]